MSFEFRPNVNDNDYHPCLLCGYKRTKIDRHDNKGVDECALQSYQDRALYIIVGLGSDIGYFYRLSHHWVR